MFHKIKNILIHIANVVFFPFYGYLNNRFRDVQIWLARIEKKSDDLNLDSRLSAMQLQLEVLNARVMEMDAHSESDMLILQESLTLLEDEIRRGKSEASTLLSAPLAKKLSPPGTVRQLDQILASSLNWMSGHQGPAAQENLWFNPPVVLEYHQEGVRLNQIHERILEIPYAFASLELIPKGGKVLDVGSTESTLPISLAMLGYQMTALDQRPYPFTHRNLEVVVEDIANWPGPGESLDAMFCISAIEHFGLSHYVSGHQTDPLDVYTLEKAADWVKPGGILVVTVPYGKPHITEKERVYGPDFLKHFSAGWRLLDQQVFIQTSPTCWTPQPDLQVNPEWTEQTRGVLMLRAQKLES